MSLSRARELRKRMTDAELCLWRHLRSRQILNCKFRRQHPIGNYIVDFVCLEKRLIVEVDGGQHLDFVADDAERTRLLESRGYHVIRFWNHEVLIDIEAVLQQILENLEAPSPRPSP